MQETPRPRCSVVHTCKLSHILSFYKDFVVTVYIHLENKHMRKKKKRRIDGRGRRRREEKDLFKTDPSQDLRA